MPERMFRQAQHKSLLLNRRYTCSEMGKLFNHGDPYRLCLGMSSRPSKTGSPHRGYSLLPGQSYGLDLGLGLG